MMCEIQSDTGHNCMQAHRSGQHRWGWRLIALGCLSG